MSRVQYNYTLYLYEKELGKRPPARYWPEARRRFSKYYREQAWINVLKLMKKAVKEGINERVKEEVKIKREEISRPTHNLSANPYSDYKPPWESSNNAKPSSNYFGRNTTVIPRTTHVSGGASSMPRTTHVSAGTSSMPRTTHLSAGTSSMSAHYSGGGRSGGIWGRGGYGGGGNYGGGY